VGDFYDGAIRRLVDKAIGLGVEISPADRARLCGPSTGDIGARIWADLHPDDEDHIYCCWGAYQDLASCTCWEPVYDVEQASPDLVVSADQVRARRSRCGDCAFNVDSPERADEWAQEHLYAEADRGTPFWCHAGQDGSPGMRRPVKWVHPDGREVPGDPANWTPPIVNGVPYQRDGTPALLCAGWAARARRSKVPLALPGVRQG
jgi:hypothetical protein